MAHGLTIELDAPLAERIKKAAAEAGVSVDQLVGQMLTAVLEEGSELGELEEPAELDRRWAAAQRDKPVPHDQVVRWLKTWGTPAFRPWPKQ
jgi:predicted transcriptional regulator